MVSSSPSPLWRASRPLSTELPASVMFSVTSERLSSMGKSTSSPSPAWSPASSRRRTASPRSSKASVIISEAFVKLSAAGAAISIRSEVRELSSFTESTFALTILSVSSRKPSVPVLISLSLSRISSLSEDMISERVSASVTVPSIIALSSSSWVRSFERVLSENSREKCGSA